MFLPLTGVRRPPKWHRNFVRIVLRVPRFGLCSAATSVCSTTNFLHLQNHDLRMLLARALCLCSPQLIYNIIFNKIRKIYFFLYTMLFDKQFFSIKSFSSLTQGPFWWWGYTIKPKSIMNVFRVLHLKQTKTFLPCGFCFIANTLPNFKNIFFQNPL